MGKRCAREKFATKKNVRSRRASGRPRLPRSQRKKTVTPTILKTSARNTRPLLRRFPGHSLTGQLHAKSPKKNSSDCNLRCVFDIRQRKGPFPVETTAHYT